MDGRAGERRDPSPRRAWLRWASASVLIERTRCMGPAFAGTTCWGCGLRPPSAFQTGGSDLRALQQLGAGSLQRNQAVDHDITAMGQPQRVIGILFDDQDGQAV